MAKKAKPFMLNRKETTKFLSNLLISDRFRGIGKYWAREVSLDYGTTNVKRVDFMEFRPEGVTSVSDIEKGIFACYEVKSCKADFNSGYGKNFITEANYFVMPMKLYKEIVEEIPHDVGVIVPIPLYGNILEEFENPTELTQEREWKMGIVKPTHLRKRQRSMIELLFCMLRSGH